MKKLLETVKCTPPPGVPGLAADKIRDVELVVSTFLQNLIQLASGAADGRASWQVAHGVQNTQQ